MPAPGLRNRIRRGLYRRAERALLSWGLTDPRQVPPPAPAPDSRPVAAPDDDTVGPPTAVPGAGGELSLAAVGAVFDELVRPALQADGGDITLIKVRDGDVYVRLVGACGSCPSSTITVREGIERLLREEFPSFGQLVQLSDYEMSD